MHEHSGFVGDLVRQYDMFHTRVVDGDLENLGFAGTDAFPPFCFVEKLEVLSNCHAYAVGA